MRYLVKPTGDHPVPDPQTGLPLPKGGREVSAEFAGYWFRRQAEGAVQMAPATTRKSKAKPSSKTSSKESTK